MPSYVYKNMRWTINICLHATDVCHLCMTVDLISKGCTDERLFMLNCRGFTATATSKKKLITAYNISTNSLESNMRICQGDAGDLEGQEFKQNFF